MPAKSLCENATARTAGASERFSLLNLTAALLDDPEVAQAAPALGELERVLTRAEYSHVCRSLVRQAFLIQLVTPTANTTLYETRWTPRLLDDPRGATADECLDILGVASELLIRATEEPESFASLRALLATSKVTCELPLDYTSRFADHLHSSSNLGLIPADLTLELARQRRLLLDRSENAEHEVFNKAFDKIKVKSYLTDRVLTGAHKTNREWRWETHPDSVHFATREDCMRIEHELLRELCALDDLPPSLASVLTTAGLRSDPNEPTRCPVTQDPFSYADVAREMLEPRHGKSSFHVGHLNPLKATNDDPNVGHTAANISWISEDGNRIQGHHPLDAVRELLKRIASNYRALGRPLD